MYLEKVKKLIELKGLTQSDVAAACGINQGNFNKMLNAKRPMYVHTLLKVAEVLQVPPSEIFSDTETTIDSKTFLDEHAMIPFYKIDAAAGVNGIANKDFPEKETDMPFKRSWLESKGYKGERIDKLILMRAKGESMEPTIADGEALLVDIGENVRTPESIEKGRVYVVRWGITKEDISVKRLFLDWPRKIAIAVSDNPLFKEVEVDLTEYEKFQDFVLGRVIWVGKENI